MSDPTPWTIPHFFCGLGAAILTALVFVVKVSEDLSSIQVQAIDSVAVLGCLYFAFGTVLIIKAWLKNRGHLG